MPAPPPRSSEAPVAAARELPIPDERSDAREGGRSDRPHGVGQPPSFLAPVTIGAFAFAVSFAASWIPNYWSDEQASIAAATRPLSSLLAMATGQVDAVHAVYYLILHYWIEALGLSEASVRGLSAVCIGAAAAGVVILGRLLLTPRAGVIAGLVFSVLPQVTWAGAEARSYAPTITAVTWLTIVFVLACRRGGWWWALYAVSAGVALSLFLYTGLVLTAHGASLLVTPLSRRKLLRFVPSALLGSSLALPVAYFAYRQRSQVAWLSPLSWDTVPKVLVEQWFGTSIALAVIAWGLVAAGLVRRGPGIGTSAKILLAGWLLLPTIALLGISLVVPAYLGRYVSFSTPALALLMAIAVEWLRSRIAIASVLVLLIVLAVPGYVQQRLPDSKGTDWRETAELLQRLGHPGDGFYFNPVVRRPSEFAEGMLAAYPAAFDEFDDIALQESYRTSGTLRDLRVPPEEAVQRARGLSRLWIVWASTDEWSTSDIAAIFADAGFTTARVYPGTVTDLYLLVRPEG